MGEFDGKRCVVTGAASGLGRETADRLEAAGAKVLRVDLKGGDAQLDVSDGAAVATFANTVRDTLGGVDALANAAGIVGPVVPVAACEEADWDRLFAVNVKGTYLMVRHLLPLMGRGAAIVNFASVAALSGSALVGPYSVTKAAVVQITRSLALAHAADGIRVNCVCPGSVETPMMHEIFDAAGGPNERGARREAILARHPMGRFGTETDIAEAVLFLLSARAAYITGVALPVDGGRTA